MAAPPDRAAAAAASSTQHVLRRMTTKRNHANGTRDCVLPPSPERLHASLSDKPHNLHDFVDRADAERGTVLYLAYGSNLSNETFRGKRGIKPISQVNVQVPSLRLTFDLPGVPYVEPCFANSGARDPTSDPPPPEWQTNASDEKTPLLKQNVQAKGSYRKDRWHKGLIGVVYEVTASDYAHIIATEGGGASYHDILVCCHPFESPDPKLAVPQNPCTPAFKAHTLFAPATPPGKDPPKRGGRFQRPDISYAQASARYLKLITDGAAECGLPYEYQDYLRSMHPYTITSNKQRIGQYVFLTLWLPIITFLFTMGRMFQDDKGRSPQWMVEFSGAVFKAVWASYDSFFKPMFGDGERTITDGGDDCSDDEAAVRKTARRISGAAVKMPQEVDVEKAQFTRDI